MSAPAPAPYHRIRTVLDVFAGVLVVLVIVLGGALWYIHRRQPLQDGTLALPGLIAPASVARDELEVAHITANNVHDAVLAQGFAMAQDRLWQMDLMRRLGEGRLSEVFGPVALEADRQARLLGLDRTIDAEAQRLRPDEAALLSAFAQGVNDEMARRGQGLDLPLEFWLGRYRPQAWQPRDSLALAAYMYQVLASGYEDKTEHETFGAKLGLVLEQQLFPQSSPWDVIPGGALPAAAPLRFQFSRPRLTGGGGPALYPAALGSGAMPARGGSNDWVLSGAHSFNGKPILANDPHLPFQIPGLWWTVELATPQFRVAGVAIVGEPGVVIGHNEHIAWGVTNTGADVQDLVREPPGTRLGTVRDDIPVRGAPAPVRFEVEMAADGAYELPIVAHDAGGPLALRWSMYAPGALQGAHVFLGLDAAQNWQQFEAALAGFAGPTQNFVYADTTGHIGYQAAGWVPIRKGFDGSVPVPAQAQYAWQGWIPFAQLPHAADPASGIMATANGRVTPDKYPYTITTDWDAPNRTRRIYQLLGQLPRWNASAMGRVQTDVVSEQDRDFAAAVVAAGAAAQGAGVDLPASTRQGLQALRGFGGAMGHTSAAPTLAVFTRRELVREVVAAKLGDALARQYHWREAPVFAQWLVTSHPPQWLPANYAAAGGGGWNGLLLHALEEVIARTTLDRATLHWGHWQTLTVLHPIFSHIPLLRRSADLGPIEINGSRLTVKQAQNTEMGAASDLGPSMRFVADLGDWDRSTLTLVAGESGAVFSPHYRDQFDHYLRGLAEPLWFTPEAVAAHTQHRLALTPLSASK